MNQSINLNLIPDGVKPVAKVSQFDVGRVVAFALYQGPDVYTPPAGTTLEFRELKSDKHICVYDDAATLSGSTITLETTQQMTAAAGEALCQFKLTNGTDVLATLNFWLDVQVDPAAEGDISETDIPEIIALAKEQMERAEAAADSAAADAESAADSKEDAETAATSAGTSATAAEDSAEDAEAYAIGTRGGADVPSTDPAYHNNSKYYSDLASAWAAHPPYVGANGDWYVYDPATQQFVDTGIDASITMQIQDVTMLSYGSTPTVTNTGTSTDAVFHLGVPRAAGVQSVSKTGSSGLVDTYRMLFQGGYFFDFQVTNGADGGGHIIEDPAGQNMPARNGLQFTGGVTVSDDSTNGRTVIEIPEPIGEQHTVTGNPLSFTTESAQVASNTVITLEPIQAGSGDPSPSNVRAISGYDSISLVVANGNDPTAQGYEEATNIVLALNDTIYSGTLDVESGELVVTKKKRTITSSDSFTMQNGTYNKKFYVSADDLKKSNSYSHIIVCDKLKTVPTSGNNALLDLTISGYVDSSQTYPNQNWIYIGRDVDSVSSFSSWLAEIGGIDVIYELATPITYHLTPHQVSLLLGANTVTTNGTSISLTYRDGQIAGLSDLEGVAESVEGLGVSKYSHEEANVLGAKNLNSYPYYETTKTENGITFTDNGDGTITVTGTATANAEYKLHTYSIKKINPVSLNKGKYIFSGCPKGGRIDDTVNYAIRLIPEYDTEYKYDFGDGNNIEITNDNTYLGFYIRIYSGYTCPSDGLTFKPMIRLASDPDDTWVPYAMTNRELTENVPFKFKKFELKYTGATTVGTTVSFSDAKSSLGLSANNTILGFSISSIGGNSDLNYNQTIVYQEATDKIFTKPTAANSSYFTINGVVIYI